MVLNQLKKVISFAMAFAVVLSLSCCGGDEDIILPDIVFVAYFYYPGDDLSGNFVGSSGYFIDSNGNIKYFDIEDKEKFEYVSFDKENSNINMEKYFEIRNLKKIHEKLKKNSINTEFEPVSKEDLIKYYKSLSKINKQTILKREISGLNVSWGLTSVYGVIINKNNEEEYILIHEYGDQYYVNDNWYAKNLYTQLLDIFPESNAAMLMNREDKLK